MAGRFASALSRLECGMHVMFVIIFVGQIKKISFIVKDGDHMMPAMFQCQMFYQPESGFVFEVLSRVATTSEHHRI